MRSKEESHCCQQVELPATGTLRVLWRYSYTSLPMKLSSEGEREGGRKGRREGGKVSLRVTKTRKRINEKERQTRSDKKEKRKEK